MYLIAGRRLGRGLSKDPFPLTSSFAAAAMEDRPALSLEALGEGEGKRFAALVCNLWGSSAMSSVISNTERQESRSD